MTADIEVYLRYEPSSFEDSRKFEPWMVDSRIFEAMKEVLYKSRIMKSDNIRKVECSHLCKHIRKDLNENLEESLKAGRGC